MKIKYLIPIVAACVAIIAIFIAAISGGNKAVNSEEIVSNPVKSITLSDTIFSLTVGDTEAMPLLATIEPADADDMTLIWTSSDESVATVKGGTLVDNVEGGLLTAIKPGTTTITVSDVSGKISATCLLTVIAPEIAR